MTAAPAGGRMDEIVELGLSIRRHVEAADLETAGRLASERLQRLQALFDTPAVSDDAEQLAGWLRDILREDENLLGALAALRGRMERELGDSRRSLRTARAYATVAEGPGG